MCAGEGKARGGASSQAINHIHTQVTTVRLSTIELIGASRYTSVGQSTISGPIASAEAYSHGPLVWAIVRHEIRVKGVLNPRSDPIQGPKRKTFFLLVASWVQVSSGSTTLSYGNIITGDNNFQEMALRELLTFLDYPRLDYLYS